MRRRTAQLQNTQLVLALDSVPSERIFHLGGAWCGDVPLVVTFRNGRHGTGTVFGLFRLVRVRVVGSAQPIPVLLGLRVFECSEVGREEAREAERVLSLDAGRVDGHEVMRASRDCRRAAMARKLWACMAIGAGRARVRVHFCGLKRRDVWHGA